MLASMNPLPSRASPVGLYLAVIQFFFALSWTVYVIFLPQLAAQVGIPRSAVIYVLMLDQLIFVLADLAMGVASDRAVRVLGRLGKLILGLTLLSCAAFLALPFVAPAGSAPLFLGIVVLWSITSSVWATPTKIASSIPKACAVAGSWFQ